LRLSIFQNLSNLKDLDSTEGATSIMLKKYFCGFLTELNLANPHQEAEKNFEIVGLVSGESAG